DIAAGTLRWADLTPAEWRDSDERAMAALKASGTFLPFEKEDFRQDGSRVPVLLGGTPFERGGGEGGAFVLDFTEQKRSQQKWSEAQEALRRTETQLTRAAQTATVGELAAAIAHEVNQPLSAVVANAHACVRWLSAQPPNLPMAQQAAERIVRDGKDAGDVVRRVRALFKRAAPETARVDLNDVIGEVLVLLGREAAKRRGGLERALPRRLPPGA